jgi:hypothetical protein
MVVGIAAWYSFPGNDHFGVSTVFNGARIPVCSEDGLHCSLNAALTSPYKDT